MGLESSPLIGQKKQANFRLGNVLGYKTELLEIRAEDPTLHVLFIPGNPGIVSFYTDFLESLYELLEGTASITAVGHISQTEKNWERGRLFSLEEQINHKMDFVKFELLNSEVPIILVGHSIGSYMSIEILRRFPEKVIYFIGLYPFLAVNRESSEQSNIRRLAICLGFYSWFYISFGIRWTRFRCHCSFFTIHGHKICTIGNTHDCSYIVLTDIIFSLLRLLVNCTRCGFWSLVIAMETPVSLHPLDIFVY